MGRFLAAPGSPARHLEKIGMNTILLGADIGGTKTRVLIADGPGRTLGSGAAGPGNHEIVGYEGMARAVRAAISQALRAAGLKLPDVSAAGPGGGAEAGGRAGGGGGGGGGGAGGGGRGGGGGVAGYDWPSQRQPVLEVLAG